MTDKPHWIVAEISKNWPESTEVVATKAMAEPAARFRFLAQRFEATINHNWEQGYQLASWKLSQLGDPTTRITETIIAVFERKGDTR